MTSPAPDDGQAPDAAFTGLVLAGGRSTRMGTDKAFVEIDGVPLIARVASVLVDSGASEVLVIGGDQDRLAALGLEVRPDLHPGEGPLGGVLTGLRATTTDLAFVTACDHPTLDKLVPRLLVEQRSLADADVCVPVVDGVRQVLAGLYHRRTRAPLTAVFESGERSLQRALRGLVVSEVTGLDATWFVDLDTADDVAAHLRAPKR